MTIAPPRSEVDSFKSAARRFATGVTVVAVRHGDHVYARTVSAFFSLSLEPLLVGAALGRYSPLVEAARQADGVGISVLSADQADVAERFARRGGVRVTGPLPVALRAASSGAPLVGGCLSWFDCRLTDVLDGGDHRILVGAVRETGVHPGEPLLHFDGGFHELADPLEEKP